MDAEIAQLQQRLTSLEAELAVQIEVAAVERASYATKEDMVRIGAQIARIEAALTGCRNDVSRLEVSLAAMRGDVARLETALVASRLDIARIDAVLDSMQKNYATKADILGIEVHLAKADARMAQMETRITRWMLATFITIMGISGSVVFGVIKLTH